MAKHSINRRTFLGTAAALAAAPWAGATDADTAPGILPWKGTTETKAALKLAKPARAKLLQITDLHFFSKPEEPALDKRTMEELPRLIDSVDPELLLLTGDLWHDNPDGRGAEYMEVAVGHLESLGRPWVFVWGNHDQLDEQAKGHERITKARHSLYRGGPGGGNYSVDLTDAAGKVVWQLACLNSNDAGLGAAQRAWLKEQGAAQMAKVPALVLAHIPMKQQAERWAAKSAAGVGLEKVSFEDEDGSSLAAIRGACDARAYFCGHDHVNDFTAVVDGVELVYGHSTGWGGYGGNEVPKGAKLIMVNVESGSYAWESLLMDGTRWHPDSGTVIDKVLDTPWDSPARSEQRARQKAS